MDSLFHAVEAAQSGDQGQMLYLLDKFKPLLLKYANQLHHDDGKSEMTLAFIETIHGIPLSDFAETATPYRLLAYIKASMRYAFIMLSKTHQKVEVECCPYDDDIVAIPEEYNHGDFEFREMIRSLSPEHQEILTYRYLYGYSDIEIASRLGVSRQAVFKARNKALSILKDSSVI